MANVATVMPDTTQSGWMLQEHDAGEPGKNAVYHRVMKLPSYYDNSMPWEALLSYAKTHYDWLESDPLTSRNSRTTNSNARLVAALFVPGAGGGLLFLSTIPRGNKFDQIRDEGPRKAPTWWDRASDYDRRRPSRLCAEDGAIYLFESEKYKSMLNYNISHYMDYTRNKFNRRNIRIACYGTYYNNPVGPQKLCSSRQSKSPMACVDIANGLGIQYWTQWKQDEEERTRYSPPASGPDPNGPGANPDPGQPNTEYGPPSNPGAGITSNTTYPPTNAPSDAYSVDRLATGMGSLQISNGGTKGAASDQPQWIDGAWRRYIKSENLWIVYMKDVWCYQASDQKWYRYASKPSTTAATATSIINASPSNDARDYTSSSKKVHTSSRKKVQTSSIKDAGGNYREKKEKVKYIVRG